MTSAPANADTGNLSRCLLLFLAEQSQSVTKPSCSPPRNSFGTSPRVLYLPDSVAELVISVPTLLSLDLASFSLRSPGSLSTHPLEHVRPHSAEGEARPRLSVPRSPHAASFARKRVPPSSSFFKAWLQCLGVWGFPQLSGLFPSPHPSQVH